MNAVSGISFIFAFDLGEDNRRGHRGWLSSVSYPFAPVGLQHLRLPRCCAEGSCGQVISQDSVATSRLGRCSHRTIGYRRVANLI